MGWHGVRRRGALSVAARRALALAAALAVTASGATAAAVLRDGPAPGDDALRPQPTASSAASPLPAVRPHPSLAGYRVARTDADVALPVRLRIPELGVDSPLDTLGQAPDRTVEVPADPVRAGWYALGPRPGQAGPAVVLGHVDGNGRPGVFFRVDELRPGAVVVVDRADGSEAHFRVTRLERMPKTSFPTSEVYLPTAGPELRLVTCGGSFDSAIGHYRDNVIAYAELAV